MKTKQSYLTPLFVLYVASQVISIVLMLIITVRFIDNAHSDGAGAHTRSIRFFVEYLLLFEMWTGVAFAFIFPWYVYGTVVAKRNRLPALEIASIGALAVIVMIGHLDL